MNSPSSSAPARLISAFAFLLVLTVSVIPQAQGQAFSVVHNFSGGSDGGDPLAGLIIDGVGNLYGSASSGGAYGYGAVFMVDPTDVQTVRHSFTGGSDGAYPEGGVIIDKWKNLYGTTTEGGVSGAGTVFRITAAGKETVLYSFTGKDDGSDPEAGLVKDAAGNLYGTTTAGGVNGNGTVFKLSPPKTKGGPWTEEVLYSFGTGTDGTIPVAGVTLDAAGNIYGTTSAGGAYGYGTVFQLTESGSVWTENILHNFQDGDDGAVPYAGLISDKSGNLYGAATDGGTGGGGTVFELTSANGVWTFNVLYSMTGWGISGAFRNLVMDAAGNIYGTTHCDGIYTAGTIYKLSHSSGSWKYTSLHVFTGGTDGLFSFSNLVFRKGLLYGTTKQGGANTFGVVFAVKP